VPYPVAACRNRNFGVSAFNPAAVTSATLRFWLDGDDLTTLFQDSAGTTPVTALDNPVGRWNSKVGSLFVVQGTAGSRPLLKAVSGGVGRGVQFNGIGHYLTGAAASDLAFMHQSPGGFTLLAVGAFTDTDNATLTTLFDSTDFDNAKIGVGLNIRDDGANVGHNYSWVGKAGGTPMNWTLDTNDNAHDTNMLTLLWAWQHGFSGNDGIFRFDGAATYSGESSTTAGTGDATSAYRIGANSGASPSRFFKFTMRHLLIYEGRASADDITALEAWAATQ
jgi:hypothetical protein